MKTENPDKLYLVALPCFRGSKGFNHRTVLLRAKDEAEARYEAYKNHYRIVGDIKEVNYES